MSDNPRVVNGYGRLPNDVCLIGEAPGKEEAYRGRPFVGKSGAEQEGYLRRHGLSASTFYKTNVVKEYREGNPNPTLDQIEQWTPTLLDEITRCSPRLIVAVGAFATRWLLGDDASLEMVHGLPHRAGAFDPSLASRGGPRDAVIVPVFHPALGLYETAARQLIDHDYSRVAETLTAIKKNRPIEFPVDEFLGCEVYDEIDSDELADIIDGEPVIAIDTEGTPDDPWSLQISVCPGTGYVFRTNWSDFAAGIAHLQAAVDRGVTLTFHNTYDIGMLRAMGVDLYRARLWDSQYAAYLLCREPQGLKPLSYRLSGMRMSSYRETVGDAGLQKQLDYLSQIVEREWEKPESRVKVENDGRIKLYQPQAVNRTAESILIDYYSGKVNKDGERTDPMERWKKVDKVPRAMAEAVLGPMPIGTLDDIPLEDAIYYSARDADAALRNYPKLVARLEEAGLTELMDASREFIPIIEEMEYNGMPASRRHFEELAEEISDDIYKIGRQISKKYYSGRPFNPNSPPQVATLLRRQGLEATKRTKTGAVSTDKKSIEHHRFVNDAIAMVFDWREKAHVRDSFCAPVLDRIPEGVDMQAIRCELKVTRTVTRRLAAANPNLLAIPIRTDIGKRVRDGYKVTGDERLGAWDESQIEARCMAHESGDELLCRLFIEDRDIHTETASRIFGIPLGNVDKMKHRLPAKNTLFGIIYGIGGPGLKTQLWKLGQTDWTDESCQEMIDEFLLVYSGVADYIKSVSAAVRRHPESEVRDHWGMPRYLPAIWCDDNKLRAEAERHAVSHRIQGLAQGMMQNAMRRLRPVVRAMQDRGEDVKWRLQVHDEIILSFHKRLWDELNREVIDAMTNHTGIALRVPIKAEGNMAMNWGDLK